MAAQRSVGRERPGDSRQRAPHRRVRRDLQHSAGSRRSYPADREHAPRWGSHEPLAPRAPRGLVKSVLLVALAAVALQSLDGLLHSLNDWVELGIKLTGLTATLGASWRWLVGPG